ncbi:hypothetical protein F2Q69_00041693 [Brassica cretica]|uniref:Uncharacterized protein n=1 Tax=Brassica cretica TaxID=69181 RepID=A0A8S9NIB7_BRACR|nr:hypothetical protein F2Q69_00041693 [Brassica cretica]
MSGCINLRTLPSGINLQSLVSVDLRKCSELNSVPDISTNISDLDLNETAIEEIPSNLRLQNLVSLRMERIKSERLWASVQKYHTIAVVKRYKIDLLLGPVYGRCVSVRAVAGAIFPPLYLSLSAPSSQFRHRPPCQSSGTANHTSTVARLLE